VPQPPDRGRRPADRVAVDAGGAAATQMMRGRRYVQGRVHPGRATRGAVERASRPAPDHRGGRCSPRGCLTCFLEMATARTRVMNAKLLTTAEGAGPACHRHPPRGIGRVPARGRPRRTAGDRGPRRRLTARPRRSGGDSDARSRSSPGPPPSLPRARRLGRLRRHGAGIILARAASPAGSGISRWRQTWQPSRRQTLSPVSFAPGQSAPAQVGKPAQTLGGVLRAGADRGAAIFQPLLAVDGHRPCPGRRDGGDDLETLSDLVSTSCRWRCANLSADGPLGLVGCE